MIITEQELWKYLKATKKPIVLYGMGNGADKIISVLDDYGIEFKGIFASDGFVRNKEFHGHKLSSYSELENKFGEMIVLLCFGSERADVIENIRKIASKQELYAPDVPVIGDGLFNEEYYLKNKEELEKIYELLADDMSRKTFINTIKYKISGKIEYLFDCEVDKDEPYRNFFKLSNSESFLDLGAYTGDTVADFISRVDDYNKIIACEPDIKSFKKLTFNTSGLKNVICENIGISNFCGTACFGMRGGRNSGTSKGDTNINFTTVDNLVKKQEITYIKMDLEGEEGKTISGAFNTISEQKPKMLISCYHRTDDLISIPKAVLSIRSDYKLYIRHFKAVPCWDTNFYFV